MVLGRNAAPHVVEAGRVRQVGVLENLSVDSDAENAVAAIATFRDRCYDFLNIFAKMLAKKMAFLTQNKAKF
jgi:hypothetical protein